MKDIGVIVIVLAVWILVLNIYFGVDKRKEKEAHVGNNVVMHGDTLMIVDYYLLVDKYKLDNGTWISSDLIRKIEIK